MSIECIDYSKVKANGKYNVYLAASLDYFSVNEVISNLTRDLQFKDMNYCRVEAKELDDINDLMAILTTYPMMDSYRVVQICDFDFKSKIFKEFLKRDIPKDTIVVIPYYLKRRDKIEKSTVISNILKKKDAMVVYEPITENRILDLASTFDLELSKPMLKKFMDSDNMDVISNDLSKIASVWDSESVTDEQILEMISKPNEMDIFDFINSILDNKLSDALDVLNDIRDKGESDVSIIIRLRSKYRELYYIKGLMDKGYKKNEIVNELKCNPYVVHFAMQTVRKLTLSKLEYGLLALVECEKRYMDGCKGDYLSTTIVELLAI